MSEFSGNFRKMIQLKKIKIAVVGLGYVGLPLAVEFAKKGFSVLGIDVDKDRIARIAEKESYITDVPTRELRKIIQSGKFRAESEFRSLKDIDAIFICVPTPLKRKNHPNISFIKSAVKGISGNLKKNCLVILESTTYPGTTEEVILPLLEKNGRRHGKDFYLCFSPERIDPGNVKYPVNKIPKVIGGITPEATGLGSLVYKSIVNQVVPVSSPRVAETVKLLENTFRLINIGLIDEMAMMANKMNIDIWEVIEAAKTKPFGFMPFYPGPGVGGHCLDKNEIIYAKEGNSLKVLKMPDFIKHIEKSKDNVEVLSFDPIKRRSVFKPVTAASMRPFSGQMVDITTEDGRHLKVTDLHPMFVYNNNKWGLKYAKDLETKDKLPVILGLPKSNQVDLFELNKNRPRNKTFKKIGKFAVVRVKDISFSKGDWVYSVETQKPHSFVTSFGIAVHNCIPKDPLYLYWKAKKFGFKSSFIKLASGVIRHMPVYVVERVGEILRQKGLKLSQARILVCGVTYKKDILDLRQSPPLDIIEALRREAGKVSYYDPLIPYLKFNNINMKSVGLSPGKLNGFDCVIIATDHSTVDYGLILKNSRVIFDSRNVYKNIKNAKIYRL